ncbi:MAG: MFS transporter, partial [bacterium]|nr:MFS transporter [bacterium]
MRRVGTWLARGTDVRPGEGPLVFASGLYFFVLLGSYFLLRPLREQFGIRDDLARLPLLFLGTLAAMIVLNPVYGWLVARFPRTKFIPLVYRFFLLNLVFFFAVYQLLTEDQRTTLGYVFFIWLSVFNLFAVSIFRQFMADNWSPEQARRLFGLIGVGGTLGAVCGSFVTTRLTLIADAVGIARAEILPWLFLATATGLEIAVRLMQHAERKFRASPVAGGAEAAKHDKPIGGSALDGLREVARSRFLLRICAFLFVASMLGSLLYFFQGKVVNDHAVDATSRTELFGWLNFAEQGTALLIQVFFTGRIIKAIGVGGALIVMPLVTIGGFIGLALMPTVALLFVVKVLRRGSQYAITQPALESLFATLPRSEKYKAKAFIDTAVKRAGDGGGAGVEIAVKQAGMAAAPLAFLGIPLAVVWL